MTNVNVVYKSDDLQDYFIFLFPFGRYYMYSLMDCTVIGASLTISKCITKVKEYKSITKMYGRRVIVILHWLCISFRALNS